MTEFDSFTNQAFLTSSGDTSISVNLGIEVYQGALPQGVAEYLSVRDIGKNASLLDDGSRCPNGSWVSQPSLKGEVVQLRSNLLGEDRNFSTSDDLVSLADLIRFRRAGSEPAQISTCSEHRDSSAHYHGREPRSRWISQSR